MNIPRKNSKKQAFTLIELLVVILIIAVLAALLLPAIAAAQRMAKKTTARTEVNFLAAAWRQYYTEYHKWPSASVLGVPDTEGNPVPMSDAAWRLLAKGENESGFNPKKLIFYTDFKKERCDEYGTPLNPWASRREESEPIANYYYYVKFDADYDNKVNASDDSAVPPDATIQAPVIAWTKDNNGNIVQSW